MSRKTLYIYQTSPIDWWQGWHRLDRNDIAGSAEKLVDDSPDYGVDGGERYGAEVAQMLEEARALAQAHLLYEGDYRQGPFLSAMPNPGTGSSLPILAWKQDNNGTTFIASRVPLSHIEREGYARVARKSDGTIV